MKISEMYPSKYLKPEDVVTLPAVLTITDLQMEAMPDKSLKPVLSFREVKKGLVCNITRCRALYSISGSDESSAWIGHRISLAVGEETFKGDIVATIRIMRPVEAGPIPVHDLPDADSISF